MEDFKNITPLIRLQKKHYSLVAILSLLCLFTLGTGYVIGKVWAYLEINLL